MGDEAIGEITRHLREWSSGDPEALARLLPVIYEELRRLARAQLAREGSGHTLQPTALVHEIYLRLTEGEGKLFASRGRFFAYAACLMRHILVDHARARLAGKRGGGATILRLEEALEVSDPSRPDLVDVLAVDEALRRLEALDERQARIVELRYFGGLTVPEAAEALGLSPASVDRSWKVARLWLAREMERR